MFESTKNSFYAENSEVKKNHAEKGEMNEKRERVMV